ISCCRIYLALGVSVSNIFMYDSKGLITTARPDLDDHKQQFAQKGEAVSLEEALQGADVFIGLSKGNLLNKDMIKPMAPNPVIFALANPDPEIAYEDAMEARPDAIMATGRSDYP